MKTIHFILALVFTFHFNVQASRIYLPTSPEVISELVKHFNSMSPDERTAYVKNVLETSDPVFYKKHQKSLNEMKWPELHYDKNELKFTQDGQAVTMKFADEDKVTINDQEVVIKKGKFGSSLEAVMNVLETKKTSFLDFFISEAHAFLPVLLIGLLAIAVMALVLYPVVSVVKAAYLKVKCFEIRNELGDVRPGSMTASQASDMKSKVRKLIADNESDLQKTNDPAARRELEQSRSCYKQVEGEITEVYPDEVNDSERGEGFLDRWTPSIFKSKSSGATAQ